MAFSTNILKDYLNPVFIETGTYKGDGVQTALDAGFETIYSFEASPQLWEYSYNRFINQPNVHIMNCDSSRYLPELLKSIKSHITFWLDAHECGDAYIDEGDCQRVIPTFDSQPLLMELRAISSHPIKDHIIIIDDMRLFNNKMLRSMIISINKRYIISYASGSYSNDILIAKASKELSR